MPVREIAKMGQPVLSEVAKPVAAEEIPALGSLAADMRVTMAQAGGVGLAAPQIFQSLRVIVFHTRRGAPEAEAQVLFNPTWEPMGPERVTDWEGCLSIPGLRGLVPRYAHISYAGLDGEGRPVAREASHFHARVLQHEIDHLEGVLYPQRMDDLRNLIFESEREAFQNGGATNLVE